MKPTTTPNPYVKLRCDLQHFQDILSAPIKNESRINETTHKMFLVAEARGNALCDPIDANPVDMGKTAILTTIKSYRSLAVVPSSNVAFVRPLDPSSPPEFDRSEFHMNSFKFFPKFAAKHVEGLGQIEDTFLKNFIEPRTAVNPTSWSIDRVPSSQPKKNSVPVITTCEDGHAFSKKLKMARIAAAVFQGETGMNFRGAGCVALTTSFLTPFLCQNKEHETGSDEAKSAANAIWNCFFAISDSEIEPHPTEEGVIVGVNGEKVAYSIAYTVDFGKKNSRVPWLRDGSQDYRAVKFMTKSLYETMVNVTKTLLGSGDDLDSIVPKCISALFKDKDTKPKMPDFVSAVRRAHEELPAITPLDELDYDKHIDDIKVDDQANIDKIKTMLAKPWAAPLVSVLDTPTGDASALNACKHNVLFYSKPSDVETFCNLLVGFGTLDGDGSGKESLKKLYDESLYAIATSAALSMRDSNAYSALAIVPDGDDEDADADMGDADGADGADGAEGAANSAKRKRSAAPKTKAGRARLEKLHRANQSAAAKDVAANGAPGPAVDTTAFEAMIDKKLEAHANKISSMLDSKLAEFAKLLKGASKSHKKTGKRATKATEAAADSSDDGSDGSDDEGPSRPATKPTKPTKQRKPHPHSQWTDEERAAWGRKMAAKKKAKRASDEVEVAPAPAAPAPAPIERPAKKAKATAATAAAEPAASVTPARKRKQPMEEVEPPAAPAKKVKGSKTDKTKGRMQRAKESRNAAIEELEQSSDDDASGDDSDESDKSDDEYVDESGEESGEESEESDEESEESGEESEDDE